MPNSNALVVISLFEIIQHPFANNDILALIARAAPKVHEKHSAIMKNVAHLILSPVTYKYNLWLLLLY